MFSSIDMGPHVYLEISSLETNFIEVSPLDVNSIELLGKNSSNVFVERFSKRLSSGSNFCSCRFLGYCILTLRVISKSSVLFFTFFSCRREVTCNVVFNVCKAES